jgi:UbiA prenyltransferase family
MDERDTPHGSPGWRPGLWWRMTRPAFLLLTVVGCALGTATASACGCGLDPWLALGATVLAVMAHAAGNVLNDLHDARSGADAGNHGGIFPFTGGSRLIQKGETSERETADLARALLLLLVPGGLLLAVKAGGGVIALGLAGLALAWAYSAPPLRLMSRGLGELTVALAWFLVVVGADVVQRGQFFVIPASVALNFAAGDQRGAGCRGRRAGGQAHAGGAAGPVRGLGALHRTHPGGPRLAGGIGVAADPAGAGTGRPGLAAAVPVCLGLAVGPPPPPRSAATGPGGHGGRDAAARPGHGGRFCLAGRAALSPYQQLC